MHILILTGKFGMGHWSASQSLRLQLLSAFPGAEVDVEDFFAYALPDASETLYKCFSLLVTRGSGLYNLYYKATDLAAPLRARPPLEDLFQDKLGELLWERRPDAVIATHPFCAQLVSDYKEEVGSDLPLVTCITDLSSHSEWLHPGTDCYLVGSRSIREALTAKGVEPGRVHVTGIPVRPQFQPSAGRGSRPGGDGTRRLLIMGGGLGMLPRLLGISVPIALSAYARSGLSTLQNLLIPRGLEKYGASKEASFTAYGTVHGMVLPVILYPSALLTVLSDLLLPELTECQVRHGRTHMNYIVNRVFKLSLIFSFLVMGVLFCCSSDLGKAVYQNEDVSFYIRIFSPLVIVMYMDTVVDGMLKGLGEQLNSMKYNIIDSFVSVLLVFFLLPHFGIEGYIATVMLSEVLNFSLSLGKLIQITELRVHLLDGVGKPLACIVLSALLCTKFLFVRLAPAGASLVPTLAFQILMISGVYFCLLFLCRSLTGEDLRWFRTLL